ncbi:hypothetical protein Tco_0445867 [Tanacetum coccineum]
MTDCRCHQDCFARALEDTTYPPVSSVREDAFRQMACSGSSMQTTHPSVHRNMSPKSVLLKTGLTPLNNGKPQHDDKGFVDSGCSRHMTGNIAYLLDFKEFDGGYVAFG